MPIQSIESLKEWFSSLKMLNLLDFIHFLNIFTRKISGGVGFYALFTQKRHLEIKPCHAYSKHKIASRKVFKANNNVFIGLYAFLRYFLYIFVQVAWVA